MLGIVDHVGHGYLMRAPGAFHFVVIDFSGRSPALRRTHHDHGPARALRFASPARFVLNLLNLLDAMFQSGRDGLMHAVALGAFYKIRLITVTAKQLLQLLATDAREDRRIVDLVSV